MNNELAIRNETMIMPSPSEWNVMREMAASLLPTGFLPSSIRTPEQATAIMLKGRELRVQPMYALSNIVIVQGKPTISAEMMLALVQRDHGLDAMWVEESTNDYCKMGYRTGGGIKHYSFTMEDANRAGVTKNPVWKQYPAAMCRARAISAVARMAFPGSIAGMYVPGELGDNVTVTSEGEVVSQVTGEIHEPAPTNARIERRAPEPTVQVSEPIETEDDRIEAMKALFTTAEGHGYTEQDIEDYFEYADIDPETVTVSRITKVGDGITKNPVVFGEWLEKQRAMREAAFDPELNPTPQELGV